MNINELREELKLNREYLNNVKIYLVKADSFFDTQGRMEKQHYTGFLTIEDNPLFPILGELRLIEKSGTNQEGKEYTLKAGNFWLRPTVTFDESEPSKTYGNTFESKETKFEKLQAAANGITEPENFIVNQIQINRFDLILFGEKVLSLPFSGFVIEKTGNFCLTFNDYSVESYEIALAKDKASDTNYSAKILDYCFEPLKAGWSWEDLAAFAETQLAEYPQFEEFIKNNYPSSGYNARKLKLNSAAQAILNKVQARKTGVAQLNAKQRITQGQIDFEAGF